MDRNLTVLLAEDNPDDALLMQRAFKAQGITNPLRIVADGSEVISYLEGQGTFADRDANPYPRFIILDLKMPRVSGLEVLAWLRAHPERMVVPTLVWSSSSDHRDVKQAYLLGANGYLVKPTDFQQFKQMLTDVFKFWDHCVRPDSGDQPLASKALQGAQT